MDYEKTYKKALERAKYWHKEGYGRGCQEVVEDIFPDLKESEDERIRKWLICGMNALKEQKTETFATIPIDDAIAWLENQKEYELSEDLGEYVTELSKQFPEVSFAKLSRIAVRVKNWLEKQGKQKNINDLSQQEVMDITVAKCFKQSEQKPESNEKDIRTELLTYLRQKLLFCIIKEEQDTIERYIDWLEKQEEKLPAGFYYVNSEGKKFYSDTLKYGNVTLHVEKQE